ncbi:MAG: hypothetical protein Q9216_001134 [Gyalolechia sp. 2 TL-2023]
MNQDRSLYALSPDISAPEPFSHSVNVSSQVKSGTRPVPGYEHLSITPKTENDGAHHIKISARRHHANITGARHRPGQHPKKSRRRPRSPEESDFEGLKPAELESEKYLRYREKARQKAKDSNGQGDNVWPDELENAFQLGESARLGHCLVVGYTDPPQALRLVPPMGRKKKKVEGKPCGRNELIAQKIKLWTGVERNRKKVSSHIQVLKHYMIDNPRCHKSTAAHPSTFPELDFDKMGEEEINSFARSRFGNIGQAAYSDAVTLPPPGGILGSNAPDRGPCLNRVEFEMFVLSPTKEKVHNYTSNQTETAARSRGLEEIRNWHTSFPVLESYFDQGPLDTDVILIESTLDLLSEYPPKNSSLSIRFMVNMTGVSGHERWSTRADYYETNGQPVDMRRFYEMNNIPRPSPWDTPNIFRGSENSDVKLEIPLQSAWWVQLFTKMAARKQEMKHDPYLSQHEDEWSRRYLQEMSVMQELWVNPGLDGASDSRVAIILWKFLQTRPGEAGTTTWRKLRPPPERIKIHSPNQSPAPPLQHSMILDSALQNLAMPQAVSAQAERFLQHSNLFTEDSEQMMAEPHSARESASPALSLDYTTSFPSSTSTSFPPSVTHGYLSHEESQGSACYSQESDCSRNGSLDAQYPFAFSQKSTYTHTEPKKTYHADQNYLSDSHGFEMHGPACYPQQSFDSISPFHAQPQYEPYDGEVNHQGLYDDSFATHYFTSGQIQLSFQNHDLLSHALPPHPSDMSHVEHSSGLHEQGSDGRLHPVTHSSTEDGANVMAEDQAHQADFDISAIEAHFAPDQAEALCAHDPPYTQHDELVELLHTHEPLQDLDGQQRQSDQAKDHSLATTVNHFDDAAFEHGDVSGRVTEEKIEDMVPGLDDGHLEFGEGYEHQGQAIEGQDECNDYDYNDHGHY